MDKKILTNYIYNILYQLVKIVLPLVVVPYTLGHLGTSTLGISDFAGNIASWFILFGILGVNVYGNREIAKVRDNKDNLSKTFFEILLMQMCNMLIACIVYACYVKYAVSENQLIYYLYLFTMMASMFDISWFFYGIEDFKAASIRNIIVKIVGVAFIFILVKGPGDLPKFVLINSFSEIFGQIIMFVQLRKLVKIQRISLIDAYKHHFLGTLALFIPTIAISVYTLLDQTMIGILTEDKANVTLYKTAQSFVKMFLYFITSIGAVMLPRIANVFYNKGGNEEVVKYVNQTFKIALLLSIPMMLAMITVSPYFIPWYLPKQPEIAFLIQVSSPIIIMISLSNVFGTQYLVPTGRNKEYTISIVLGATSNFFANLLLIPKFQAAGACIGSIIAETVVTFVQYLFVRKDISIKIDSSLVKYLFAGLIMSFGVVGIGKIMSPSILCNVIQASIGALLYFSVLIISKESLASNLVGQVKKRVFK